MVGTPLWHGSTNSVACKYARQKSKGQRGWALAPGEAGRQPATHASVPHLHCRHVWWKRWLATEQLVHEQCQGIDVCRGRGGGGGARDGVGVGEAPATGGGTEGSETSRSLGGMPAGRVQHGRALHSVRTGRRLVLCRTRALPQSAQVPPEAFVSSPSCTSSGAACVAVPRLPVCMCDSSCAGHDRKGVGAESVGLGGREGAGTACEEMRGAVCLLTEHAIRMAAARQQHRSGPAPARLSGSQQQHACLEDAAEAKVAQL